MKIVDSDNLRHIMLLGIADFYQGKLRDDKDWGPRRRQLLIHNFTRRTLFREILDGWSADNALQGIVLIEGHGGYNQKRWTLQEKRNKITPVQEWVEQFDGKVAALFIQACNSRHSRVSSQKSLVMHPDRSFNWTDVLARRLSVRLFVPGEGYVEKEYGKMKRIIGDLKSR